MRSQFRGKHFTDINYEESVSIRLYVEYKQVKLYFT